MLPLIGAPAPWSQDNVLFVGLVILVLSLVMLLVTRRRLAQREARSQPGRQGGAVRHSRLTGQAQSHELQQSMREMMLELEQLSREINSQVDTRLRALNLLVQEADEKIRQLQRLGGLGDRPGAQFPTPPPPRKEPHPQAASERYAQVYALAEKGLSVVEIARDLKMMTGEVELILALRRTSQPEDREGRA